jgi:hypothetical protein
MKKTENVKYTPEMGAYEFPEGFRELLVGKSIEEQCALYRVTGWANLAKNEEWQSRDPKAWYTPIEEEGEFRGLILEGDLVVGILLSDDTCHPTPCFPGEGVCTWDASDNNGAGYKTRVEYRYLACVSPDFKKE